MRSFPVLLPMIVAAAALSCGEDHHQVTGPEAPPTIDAAATTALVFYQLSAGSVQTCAVTTDQRAYCWGVFTGDGTNIERMTPVAVAPTLRFRNISSGLSTPATA
jgi:hypothetical protein